MRNFKAIGLAALMALALSAMVASAASGEEGIKGGLTGGETPNNQDVTLHGDREGGNEFNFFEMSGTKWSCSVATFTGTLEENHPTADPVTIAPHYAGCAMSGLPTTFNVTDCDYTLLQPTKLIDGTYTSEVELYCPEGKSMTLEVFLSHHAHTTNEPFAVFHLAPHQSTHEKLGGHVVYTPKSDDDWDDVTIDITITGLPYVLTPSTKATDGVYRSTVTLSAWGDKEGTHEEQRDLWFHDEE